MSFRTVLATMRWKISNRGVAAGPHRGTTLAWVMLRKLDNLAAHDRQLPKPALYCEWGED